MNEADTERFGIIGFEACDKELDKVKVLIKKQKVTCVSITPIGDTAVVVKMV